MSDALTLSQVHVRRTQKTAAREQAFATPRILAGALVVAATLAVYLATMAPDLYSMDSPELATAAYRLGIAHAPGYPLYTLSGWLFSHAFPVGSVAFRFNLFSVFAGVAAAAVVYALALRFTQRPIVAAAGALALSFSYFFWLVSLVAEVYALDALLYAAMLLAALSWRDRPTAARAALVGLALGLAAANRTTSISALPALLAFAWVAGERSPRAYVSAAAGLAAGLAFYAYLPLRAATGAGFGPGDYGLDGALQMFDVSSWGGFWDHVTARRFQNHAFAYGPADLAAETATFGGWFAGAFLIVGLPLGAAGIVRQWRHDRAGLLLLAGCALPIAIFFVNYGTIDKKLMFVPVYVTWALWVVGGLDWALDAAGVAEMPALAALALALPAIALVVNWPLVTQHGERSVRADAEARFEAVAADGIVAGRFTDIAPMQYLQEVEGQRRDVRLVNDWTLEPAFLVALADANAGSTPFYVTQRDANICSRFDCVPAGSVWEVRRREH